VTGGQGPNGLPLAMQVVGRIDDDAKTLLAAHWIHTVLKQHCIEATPNGIIKRGKNHV